jgi:hypothetical protein
MIRCMKCFQIFKAREIASWYFDTVIILYALRSIFFSRVTLEEMESTTQWGLIEWLETLRDLQIMRTTFAQLQLADGDRERAGWLKWDDVEQELG